MYRERETSNMEHDFSRNDNLSTVPTFFANDLDLERNPFTEAYRWSLLSSDVYTINACELGSPCKFCRLPVCMCMHLCYPQKRTAPLYMPLFARVFPSRNEISVYRGCVSWGYYNATSALYARNSTIHLNLITFYMK